MILEDKPSQQLYRTALLHELWARTNLSDKSQSGPPSSGFSPTLHVSSIRRNTRLKEEKEDTAQSTQQAWTRPPLRTGCMGGRETHAKNWLGESRKKRPRFQA